MSIISLNPTEILMLHYAPSFHTGENKFQQFWTYRYDVNPYKVLEQLYNHGFIELDTVYNSLNRKTIDELKGILADNNLKVSGNKKELIDRVITCIDEKDLFKYIPCRYYCLTNAGADILNDSPNIVFIHRHPEFELTIYDVPPDGNIYDFILHNLDERETEYMYYNNWDMYQLCRSHRAKIAQLQNDAITELKYLFEICYIEISGLRNGVEPSRLTELRDYILNAQYDATKSLTSGNIDRIRNIAKRNHMTNELLTKICKDVISNTHLPFHLHDDDSAFVIIMGRLNGILKKRSVNIEKTDNYCDIYKECNFTTSSKERILKALIIMSNKDADLLWDMIKGAYKEDSV